jgi:hypothetical protein
MGVTGAETWRLLRKAGWDSVPAVRCAVLDALARSDEEPATYAELQVETGLPAKTAERIVEDLVSLRLATREKVSGKWHVAASRIALDYWAGERSPETSEGGQRSRSPETSKGGKCAHPERWRARDGQWRCSNCDPPVFAGEVLEEQST